MNDVTLDKPQIDLNKLKIRYGHPSDALRISELLTQMNYANTERFMERKIKELREQAADHLFVAELDSFLIGFLALHITPQLALEHNFARIVYFCIDSEYRGHGIGEAMLCFAEKYAVEQGCSMIELHSSSYRVRAHNFYLSHGYQEHPKYLIKHI